MEGRQRVTLYDQLTAGNSSNHRDSLASLMLDDVVFKNRSRTLQDIICEDQPNNNNNAKDHRKPWKAFKNKLRLKRATVNNNDSDASTQHNSDQRQQPQNDVVQEDVNNSDLIIRYGSPVTGGESNNHSATAAVSLMHLLEETEQEMDLCMESDDDNDGNDVEECEKEEEEEEVEGGGGGGVVEYNCCVCMVRHKGAAFIPCGHTFCRMCSREIWVNRGNCPLCNNLILEILDIF